MNNLIPNINRRRSLVPFMDSVSSLEKEFYRFFDDSFFTDSVKFLNSRSNTLPKLNIAEFENRYDVDIAIPGIKSEDVDITIKNNKLYISCESSNVTEEKESKYIFREVSKRAFNRIIPFPKEIDSSKSNAVYENGMIKLEIPKMEEQPEKRGRKIKIR